MRAPSIGLTLAILAAAGGCQSSGSSINTGLTRYGAKSGSKPAQAGTRPAPTAPASPRIAAHDADWSKEPAVDIQALLDRTEGRPPKNQVFGTNEPPKPRLDDLPSDPQTPITEKDSPAKLAAADGSLVTVTVDPLKDAGVSTIGNTAPPKERPLEQRIDDAAVALIDLLAQQSMAGKSSWRNYIALAALDALHPGAVPKVITPGQSEGGPLAPEERQAVESLRSFFAGIAGLAADASPDARADRIAELCDTLQESRPLRIRTAALCSRVAGYGRFTPLASSRFQQGASVRAIVYTEIAGFGHRPIADSTPPKEAEAGDRWSVELSQALLLYHDADGVLAWSRPEERITETSRNKRKDFFIIHDVTLPRTLTIGAYRLKVILKDKVTGRQDEAVIPFEVIAETQASGN